MHRFFPVLVMLSIAEIILFIAFINILVAIPYYPTFLAGILVVILMVVVLLMVIVYRGIDRLWKTIYGYKGS